MPSPLDPPGAVPLRNLNVSAFPPRSFPHSCNARFLFLTIEGMAPQPHYAHKSFRIRSYENTGGWGCRVFVSPPLSVGPLFSSSYKPLLQQLFCIHIHTNRPGVARRVISRTLPFLATRSIHAGLAVSRSSL